MISMCGKRRAMLVSVMDGHRPQIRCEGRWRDPYMAARYGAAESRGSGKWCQSSRCERPVRLLGVPVGEGRGYGVLVTESGSCRRWVLGRGFHLTLSTPV